MKLTLIKPNLGRMNDRRYIDEGRMEPLQLGVLAALTPPEIEVVLYDDRLEDIPFEEPTDLVAVTVETFTARRAYEISAEYRRRGVPVILGGFHPTLLPEEAAEHADALVLGDAEAVWRQVIEDARRAALQPEYRGEWGTPQSGIIARRDLFRGKGYLPLTLLQFGRGCVNSCEFCAINVFFEGQHRVRPVPEVLEEIAAQKRRRLFFIDDNLLADREAAKELFRALIPLKVHWVSQAAIDMVEDPELMELMMRSGCIGLVVGFESIDPRSLASMGKGLNLSTRGDLAGSDDCAASDDFEFYTEPLRIVREHGLQLWAAFTIGHDHDTPASIERTIEFAIEQKFCFAAFNVLTPYPGTPLYERLAVEGRLLFDGKWWIDPRYRFNDATFLPAHMSPQELTDLGFQARRRFNSPGSIIKRAFDFKTNMRSPLRFGVYLKYNPLFRKEVYKKQGMHLGYEKE